MKHILMLLMTLSFLVLVGCGKDSATHHKGTHLIAGESQQLANGDLQEATASIEVLPSFLDHHDDVIKGIYKIAAAHADVLQWMPCYCGCSMSADHQHNGHCFYKEIQEDGTIVWDDHGTRCNVCIEIAAYSIKLHQDGMSISDIRDFIDETYKVGYAEPTPTPKP